MSVSGSYIHQSVNESAGGLIQRQSISNSVGNALVLDLQRAVTSLTYLPYCDHALAPP